MEHLYSTFYTKISADLPRRKTTYSCNRVGGVDSAETAYTKVKAGASLIQLYTATYKGPRLFSEINKGLSKALNDNIEHISEAVGIEADYWASKAV